MALDPALRVQRARLAAYARAAQHDGPTVTAAARQQFNGRFLREIDERFPGLPEAERQRRAGALRKAYFAKLAYLSAKARRHG